MKPLPPPAGAPSTQCVQCAQPITIDQCEDVRKQQTGQWRMIPLHRKGCPRP